MKTKNAYHGGDFFKSIGENFSNLEKASEVISADVLDAPFDVSPKVLAKIKKYLNFALRTSPPTHCEGLLEIISKKRGIPQKNILAGAGSSDLMFLLFPHFLNEGDKVLILDPMYGEYAHIFKNVIKTNLLKFRLHKENSFEINLEEYEKNLKKTRPRLAVIVNPNSPTGKFKNSASLFEIIQKHPNTVFVIDETYIDYVGSAHSLEKRVPKCQNLIIIKSLSKVYALSGARVAYMVLPEKIKSKIEKYSPPWSVSLPAQIAAVESLKEENFYKKERAKVLRWKSDFARAFAKDPELTIYDSAANFFLVEVKNCAASEILKILSKKKIFLRNCDSMGGMFKDNFIRVAVKKPTQNRKILRQFKLAKNRLLANAKQARTTSVLK